MSITVCQLSESGEKMRCPKCKQEQNNSIECDACGVIFEKYRKVQDRKREADALEAEKSEDSGTGRKILQLILLVVVVAATTYYFTGYRQQKALNQVATQSAPIAIEAPVGSGKTGTKSSYPSTTTSTSPSDEWTECY